jgi:putative transposase
MRRSSGGAAGIAPEVSLLLEVSLKMDVSLLSNVTLKISSSPKARLSPQSRRSSENENLPRVLPEHCGMKKERYHPLQPGCYYHIYNRGNNSQPVFRNPCDYISFLQKWEKYISPVADTYAYCLLENHFHATIETHSSIRNLETAELITMDAAFLQKQFHRLFTSFAKSQHAKNGSNGAVFKRRFQRSEILNDDHFRRVIAYNLLNTRKHRIQTDCFTYPYSSLQFLHGKAPAFLAQDALYNMFGCATELELYLRNYEELYFPPRQI